MADQTGDTPVLDLLATMTAASLDATNLNGRELALVRIGALVAVGAPPASYLLNLGTAGELGVDVDDVQGVLAAVAPIAGTPRVVAAAGNMARALGLALDIADDTE